AARRAARLDTREGQLPAEDVGHLPQGQSDLEDVAARLVAGALPRLALPRPERLPDLSRARADAARPLVPEAELRDVDRRQGDADQVAALLADHLAPADVFRQVALHLAAYDPPEALVIVFDSLSHGCPP